MIGWFFVCLVADTACTRFVHINFLSFHSAHMDSINFVSRQNVYKNSFLLKDEYRARVNKISLAIYLHYLVRWIWWWVPAPLPLLSINLANECIEYGTIQYTFTCIECRYVKMIEASRLDFLCETERQLFCARFSSRQCVYVCVRIWNNVNLLCLQ